jgi:hypothetical protein
MRCSLYRRNVGGTVNFVVVPLQIGHKILFRGGFYGGRTALDQADPPRWGI